MQREGVGGNATRGEVCGWVRGGQRGQREDKLREACG